MRSRPLSLCVRRQDYSVPAKSGEANSAAISFAFPKSEFIDQAHFRVHGPAYQPIFLELPGRVDSVHGGLRVRFESAPDAPLTKAILTAQGAGKGLFQNSTNICKGTHRATLKLDAQSGKVSDSQPKVVAQCKGQKKKAKHGGHR